MGVANQNDNAYDNASLQIVTVTDFDTSSEEWKESVAEGPHVEASAEIPPVPPNGGSVAWLQVLGAFILFFNTWGIINIYGVYQTYYELHNAWGRSASDISWIGSVQSFLLFFGSAAAGPAFDLGYLKTMLVSGTFLVVLGLMITSICREYWHVMLSQALVVGLGFGCLFLPTAAIISQYFTTRKSLAYGIASLGSSLGGVIYQIVFQTLQEKAGFGWATRVIGFIVLGLQIIAILVMKRRLPLKQGASPIKAGLRAFTDRSLSVYTLAIFFGFMGVYISFFYIQLYALQKSDTDTYLASYLLAIINGCSTLGRIFPNLLADRIGPLNTQIPFALVCSLLCFGWIGIISQQGIVAFCAFYGFFSGPFNSLPGITVISLSPDMLSIGVQIGISLTISGCGILIGNPIAGAILSGEGGWPGLQVWCGVLLFISASLSLLARTLKVGLRVNVRV